MEPQFTAAESLQKFADLVTASLPSLWEAYLAEGAIFGKHEHGFWKLCTTNTKSE